MTPNSFLNTIDTASKVIGKTWPLYSFVTSNPLSGYEHTHFKKAARHAEQLLGGNVFPDAQTFRQAWEQGDIETEELTQLLVKNGMNKSPEQYLEQLEHQKKTNTNRSNPKLDRIMVKWLSVFMDEGLSEWEMPNKSSGFFKAWRTLAPYDSEIGTLLAADLPSSSHEALTQTVGHFSEKQQLQIFESHLAALPGWTGYIKYRVESNSMYQNAYPITLQDYLAVRLCIAQNINTDIDPSEKATTAEPSDSTLSYVWLKSWEQSWQNKLTKTLLEVQKRENKTEDTSSKLPDAQLVFCIDTRSELMRRHVEAAANYETFGYAGFFGIAMDYKNLEDGLIRKSCPPIVASAYIVDETAQKGKESIMTDYKKETEQRTFSNYFLTRMKNMLPSAFGYVEGAGLFYGVSLLLRTLFPGELYNRKKNHTISLEESCEPSISAAQEKHQHQHDISLEEKTAIVKSAFDLLGWNQFSPIILFVGHGSHSANNPFGSSLDCGACAASPGRHNARMLAKLANQIEVRQALKEHHNITIPTDTVFIGAEHNTTTDDIVVFDSEVPNVNTSLLRDLKNNLKIAQQTAINERLGIQQKNTKIVDKKSNNWSETRPEWGLAKNAGFIVGPRSLTKHINLGGHCFLNSYDWELDTSGEALEGIMQGPMVVTQWINSHYYFATVDNDKFGGGSKITHNITGKFGVVQGNGGDLKIGLPLQSIKETDDKLYHKPLRLSVIIQAPTERIEEILNRNEHLKTLLDNEWIYLLIMDPKKNNSIERYRTHLDDSLVAKESESIVFM